MGDIFTIHVHASIRFEESYDCVFIETFFIKKEAIQWKIIVDMTEMHPSQYFEVLNQTQTPDSLNAPAPIPIAEDGISTVIPTFLGFIPVLLKKNWLW